MEKEEKQKILEKFKELKNQGEKATLANILTEEQKKDIKKRNAKKPIIKPHKIENIFNEMEHTKNIISKYFDKLSTSSNVKTLMMIDNLSFTFEFKNKYFYIGYDPNSLCITINDGQEFDTNTAHEIDIYDLEQYF